MLPVAVAVSDSVAAVYSVAGSIAIVDEVIVIVDVDGVVAAPSGVITPTPAPHGSHGDPNAE